MTDKRTCGNCVECIFISKRKDKEWGSVYDWLCRERGITLVCFAAENEFLACSRHRYYDECFEQDTEHGIATLRNYNEPLPENLKFQPSDMMKMPYDLRKKLLGYMALQYKVRQEEEEKAGEDESSEKHLKAHEEQKRELFPSPSEDDHER